VLLTQRGLLNRQAELSFRKTFVYQARFIVAHG